MRGDHTVTWKRTTSTCAAAVAALVLSVGCGSGDSSSQHSGDDHGPTTSASISQDHNDTDAGFAQSMIPHHQQAIEMSDIMLAKQGIDPRVIDLATKIKAAQDHEIEQMQDWLSQWGIPPTPDAGHGGHDMEGNGDAMGMMSPDHM